MYTGCDLGTNSKNMRLLKNYTPYILDALDSPHVDTSVSTGFGVWTAISKILETAYLPKPIIAVHGLGKVGRQVAQQCLLNGCDVIGYDIDTSIEAPCGTRVVSEDTFWSTRSDVLCTASTSGLLTNAHVNKLKTNWIVSAANSPFQDDTVESHAIAAGINYLPDFATNAGAVLCDGVERTFPEIYSHMSQFQANEYVAAMIGAKTQEVLRRADILDRKIHEIVRFAHFGNLRQPELQVIAG